MTRFPSVAKLGFAGLALVLGGVGSMRGAVPIITSAASVDIYYDSENPGDTQFGYRIVASGAPTAFEARGLPASATLDAATGWITGSRNAPGTYEVTIRAKNPDGTATAKVHLAIHPGVIGVRSAAGVYHAGQTFTITLHYNATVVVTGTPHLALAIGPAGAIVFKEAAYASGTGSSDLTFHYTVVAADEDPDGVQLLPRAPGGGTICDASGLAASPSLPVRHFVSGITIQQDGGVAVANTLTKKSGLAPSGGRMITEATPKQTGI